MATHDPVKQKAPALSCPSGIEDITAGYEVPASATLSSKSQTRHPRPGAGGTARRQWPARTRSTTTRLSLHIV